MKKVKFRLDNAFRKTVKQMKRVDAEFYDDVIVAFANALIKQDYDEIKVVYVREDSSVGAIAVISDECYDILQDIKKVFKANFMPDKSTDVINTAILYTIVAARSGEYEKN